MQRQHGLSSPDNAFQQMAVPEESSASSSKADKARLSREERFIHLIPLLTFLCFFLLFLCSHDPSAAGKSRATSADLGLHTSSVGGQSGNRKLRML